MNIKEQLNFLGAKKEPFLFIIDFDINNFEIIPLSSLTDDICFQMDKDSQNISSNIDINKTPIDYSLYEKQFNNVQENILNGNTYLLNLTSQTSIDLDMTLKQIYDKANAKFKLYFKDKFVCFTPERFVEIKENKIYTYPMKGTIDAGISNAKEKLLNDKKELAEHTMVVDLLRNDLSIVSKNVKVEEFRYCDKIKAGKRELLQTSSKISGELEKEWHKNIGNILISLLPAGSITGTPKKKTIQIIKDIENYDRGFFTGVFGVFNGDSLDSAVMIRYIEKKDDGSYVYKSGGGITCDSDISSEYQEMINKVYIP